MSYSQEVEQLDLRVHGPLQWEGKAVQVNGAVYVLDVQLGQGATAFVRLLRNVTSGLTHHVLKLYRRPEEAEAGMEVSMAKVTHLLRHGFKNTPWIMNIEVPGGIAQMQEYRGPYEANYQPQLQQADALLSSTWNVAFERDTALTAPEREKVLEAVRLCRQLLEANPRHTVALNQLANAYAQLHEWTDAANMQLRAIAIEPNVPDFICNAVSYTAMAGLLWTTCETYDRLKKIFPYVVAVDHVGIRSNLECGRIDQAERILQSADTGDKAREDVFEEVASARAAREKVGAIYAEAKRLCTGGAYSPGVSLLEAAARIDEHNPLLRINLGLAYRGVGRNREAAELLGGLLAVLPPNLRGIIALNAAICEARQGNLSGSISLLHGASLYIFDTKGAVAAFFDLRALPGYGYWVEPEGVVQSLSADLITEIVDIVDRVDSSEAVSPEVRELVAIYAAAAERA